MNAKIHFIIFFFLFCFCAEIHKVLSLSKSTGRLENSQELPSKKIDENHFYEFNITDTSKESTTEIKLTRVQNNH